MTDRIPGANEPDPENQRFRPFQGGTDSLPGTPAQVPTYGTMKYMDDHGPADAATAHGGGAGSGLSGLPQADSGQAPARFNDPDTPPGNNQA